MKLQEHLGLMEFFPFDHYLKPTKNQISALEATAKNDSTLLELPTGSGKTAIGYTFLRALESSGKSPLFYIVPNKTLVNQVRELHPDVKVVYGRNEYPCLFYTHENVSADESPCSMLDCPHRVNQETGETEAGGVEPCPYLQAKYKAKQGGIIVCTMSFYLFTHLFSKEWEETEGLVIDEVHRLSSVFRSSLSYEITDHYLEKVIELLSEISPEDARIISNFRRKMMDIIKSRPPRTATLLEGNEVIELLGELYKIDPRKLRKDVKEAVRRGNIDPVSRREVLKKTETITRSLVRYLKSLEYSLPTAKLNPLNYSYAYYEKDPNCNGDGNGKSKYRLVIKAYYVAPLIRKILPEKTLAYSATIGDPEIIKFETGINFPFYTFPSEFPAKNTRIFLPTDTPNLAMKSRNRQDLTRSLRKIAKAAKTFADSGLRSLVVVVSELERQKFMMLAGEEGVKAISYGNGVKPRIAAEKFKSGEGDVLVGTVSNYGEGVDFPKKIAQVTFFLRPGYSNPNDPLTIFEERRYGNARWRIWNWRVMLEALQVRGRNVRSAKDTGVTIFVSQQFNRFLFASLPAWLKESYEGKLKWNECVNQTLEMFGK